ncbi:MAG: hypothetical protein ACXAC5_02500 [Promethearchaeota archaeon]|jgi:hypothetical protein
MNWFQRTALKPSQMTQEEFLTLYSPNREGEQARTSIIGTDNVAYVGGRNHGDLLNMAREVGIPEEIVLNGRASFTEPSGHSFDIHGRTIKPDKVVRVDVLWHTKQTQEDR